MARWSDESIANAPKTERTTLTLTPLPRTGGDRVEGDNIKLSKSDSADGRRS